MPAEFPRFNGTEKDPRATLVRFVSTVRQFLGQTVRSNRDPFGRPLFWKDLLPRMRQAWGELERQGDFRKVERQIQQIEPGDRRWRDHGLRGRQLAFKLAVIRFLQGRYYLLGKSILRKLLDTIDDLLKSILDAVGGGRGILELKDFIKHSIDD